MKVSASKEVAGLFYFMASQQLTVGTVAITGYLLINARKASDPGVIAASQNFAPAGGPPYHPPFRNITFTGLDPEVYLFDFRESPDGIALGTLFATREINVKDNILLRESRYYRGGGGGANDPAANSDTLTDTYLNGKTIYAVHKESKTRPLFPPSEITKEYDLVSGGGIQLLGGDVFSQDEGIVIEIDFLAEANNPPISGIYNGVINITANTTFNSTHRNKRLRCESNSSGRQVNTMEALSGLSEGTTFYLMQNGGNQLQTKFVTQGSDQFKYFDSQYNELTIAPGEFIWLEVRVINATKYYEVIQCHPGVLQVGELIVSTWKDHPNTKPEDGSLYDGDDYPRLYWWIINRLPLTHKIIDDTVVNVGYTHPADKLGCFVVHSTLKKFRVPNTQNLSHRALKNFTALGSDAARLYDYGGGVQNESVGGHTHPSIDIPTGSHSSSSSALSGLIRFLVNTFGSGGSIGQASGGGMLVNNNNPTGENRVKNIGVYHLRRF